MGQIGFTIGSVAGVHRRVVVLGGGVIGRVEAKGEVGQVDIAGSGKKILGHFVLYPRGKKDEKFIVSSIVWGVHLIGASFVRVIGGGGG